MLDQMESRDRVGRGIKQFNFKW